MHEPRAQAHSPQRGRAHLVRSAADTVDRKLPPQDLIDGRPIMLRHRHDDPVAGADVVQQKIAEGVKCLLAQRRRDGVSAAVEYGPRRGCHQGAHVTGDRKSTRLNSSHPSISYAVFCLKKKKKKHTTDSLYMNLS